MNKKYSINQKAYLDIKEDEMSLKTEDRSVMKASLERDGNDLAINGLKLEIYDDIEMMELAAGSYNVEEEGLADEKYSYIQSLLKCLALECKKKELAKSNKAFTLAPMLKDKNSKRFFIEDSVYLDELEIAAATEAVLLNPSICDETLNKIEEGVYDVYLIFVNNQTCEVKVTELFKIA